MLTHPDERESSTDTSNDVRQFAAALRARRLQAGLSQEELAARTQLSVRGIANIEAGRVHRPHVNSIRKLLDELQVTGAEREALEQWPRRRRRPTGIDPLPTDLAFACTATSDTDWSIPGAFSPPRRTPHQLPTDIAQFTGRTEEVSSFSRHLSNRVGVPPSVVVVAGRGGIGKTTLAVHVAHKLASEFPDGQLFADLGGLGRPRPPEEILGGFLRALGVGEVPDDPAERVSLFRTVIATHRILIVLDGALDERQVRPLLPGSGQCATIITSRSRLGSLECSHTMELELFSQEDSLALLGRIITTSRVRNEYEAAQDIIHHCGGLPLAVRIAGARLSARPETSLRSYANNLADERYHLERLRLGDLEVRSGIELSHTTLTAADSLALRRLVLAEMESFSSWILASLVDISPIEAALILKRLADHRMVDTVGSDPTGDPRYKFHDLVRLVLRERVEACDALTDRLDALDRVLSLWLTVAESITQALPTISDQVTMAIVSGGKSGIVFTVAFRARRAHGTPPSAAT